MWLNPTGDPACLFSQMILPFCFVLFCSQIHPSDMSVSWLLSSTCKEEEVPTQGKYVHCWKSRSSSRRYLYFSYCPRFIDTTACNKIYPYEVYLIYFDNYTQLCNHHCDQDRKHFHHPKNCHWPLKAMAFKTKNRLICSGVVRKDFIGGIEKRPGMRIKFWWAEERSKLKKSKCEQHHWLHQPGDNGEVRHVNIKR